jgi:hypothetical protein
MSPLRRLLQRTLQRAVQGSLGPAWRWRTRLHLRPHPPQELDPMPIDREITNASEALVAMPLPAMLQGLGMAVAIANQELAKVPGPNGTVMTVQQATIDMNIAISVESSRKIEGGAELGLKAFSVNASYARTFGFKEEASSRISMTLAIKPADS